MELTFDIRGNLIPYEKLTLTLDEFKEIFVNSFDEDSSRTLLFENYLNYIKDFQEEVTTDFIQWINGSFATNKKNPKDIDFVTLINYEDYATNRLIIDDKYRLNKAKALYKVDAYTIEVFPEEHKKYLTSKSDLLYWNSWFSKTKRNRRKKSFPKGFIEIIFKN